MTKKTRFTVGKGQLQCLKRQEDRLKMYKKKGAMRTEKLRQTGGTRDNEYPPNKQLAVGIQQQIDTSTPDVQERSGQPENLIFSKETMNP